MPKTLNRRTPFREYVGFLIFAALISSAAWMFNSLAAPSAGAVRIEQPLNQEIQETRAKSKSKRGPKTTPSPPPCPHCAPAGHQEIYIPLIELKEAAGGEIVFNSRSPKAMEVTPIFFKLDGTVVNGKPVTVESEEIRYVDVIRLLPEEYRNQRNWGGLSLSYEGFNREMWSQFRFLGVNGGSNVDEFFTVKEESRSDELQAVWWMPGKSEAIIALGNITDVATSATVSFSDKQQRSVRLGPHATEILRFHSEKEERSESVVVNVTGAAGSIVPTGLITSKDGKFNSVIRFYSPNLTKQSNLYANGFRVSENTPHMTLKNTTTNSVAVVPKFTPLTGTSPFSLAPISLAPGEAREADLTTFLHYSRKRHDFDVVSVEVTNLGAPGSIIGSLCGINDRTGGSYDVPLRDSGPIRTMTGSYPWNIGEDFTTVAYITFRSPGWYGVLIRRLR